MEERTLMKFSMTGKQRPVAGQFSMATQLPYGCCVGCQGFVESRLDKSTTTFEY